MKRNLPNLARVFTVRQERAERARHQASAESRRLAQEAALANAAVQQAAARRTAALRQCDADPGNEQARLWRCWSEEQKFLFRKFSFIQHIAKACVMGIQEYSTLYKVVVGLRKLVKGIFRTSKQRRIL